MLTLLLYNSFHTLDQIILDCKSKHSNHTHYCKLLLQTKLLYSFSLKCYYCSCLVQTLSNDLKLFVAALGKVTFRAPCRTKLGGDGDWHFVVISLPLTIG